MLPLLEKRRGERINSLNFKLIASLIERNALNFTSKKKKKALIQIRIENNWLWGTTSKSYEVWQTQTPPFPSALGKLKSCDREALS